MSRSTSALRRPITVDRTDVRTPDDIVHMDAVVAACALLAQADGWVTPDKRKGMIDRMRQSPSIIVFGVDEIVVAFEALNMRFERDLDDGDATAEIAVRRLRGQAVASRRLVDTACSIAEADGAFDAGEREVILRLCRLLDLDPPRHDLAPGYGERR